MKKFGLVSFLIFILFTCILQIQYAAALEIKLSKPSYLQGETFLATIKADFLEPLNVQNIFFRRDDKEIGPAFYLLQISKQHYYVWVDLPNQAGNYSFGIENIIYREDGKLTGKTKQVDFIIKQTIAPIYQDLIQEMENKWNGFDTETNSFALLALAWHDALASQGLAALNEKSKDGEQECWPSACKVKETALALLALAELEEKENLHTSWLEDAQNNLDTGLWDLSINSNAEQLCQLQINNNIEELNLSQGTNTINLNLKNKPEEVTIKINCSVVSARVIHTYLGKLNEFEMQKQGSEFTILMNNKKCYGQDYRSNCEREASANAALALNKLGLSDNSLINWLKAEAETTQHKAIALYLKDSTEIKDWLINNQHQDGYWSHVALLESTQADFEASIWATMALEKRKSTAELEKAKLWLREQLSTEDLKDKALALAFIFTKEQIEPLITVNPAAIKTITNNTISVEIRNKGISEVDITALLEPFKLEKTLSVLPASSEILSFDVPSKIGKEKIEENITASIELEYKLKISDKKSTYSIPVIIFPVKEVKENGIEIKILPEHLRFELGSIDATLLTGESNLIEIPLRNLASIPIGNISVSYTRSLKKILDIEPTRIDSIEAGKSKSISITIQHHKKENFSGEITAESSSQNITATFPLIISFTENESLVKIPLIIEETKPNKTCKDFNGTLCKKDERCEGIVVATEEEGRCCFGKCIRKSNVAVKIIGVMMVLVAISIIAAFIYLKLKKPKKQTKDIYEEIEKRYSKFRGKIEPKG